jgi:hypothetical protein
MRALSRLYSFLLLGLLACVFNIDIAAGEPLKRYDGKMVSFSYPAGWKMKPGFLSGLEYNIMIENDESAILFITFHDYSDKKILKEIIREDQINTPETPVSETAGTLSEVRRSFGGKIYSGFRREYSVTLSGDIFSISKSKMRKEYFLIDCKPRSVEVAAQASDAEWPELDRVVATVADTLELRCR